MSTPVRIIEVGPRDGLQNESTIISTADKLAFISALIDAGCREIEVASFVHPKLVPAMADSAEVVKALGEKYPSLRVSENHLPVRSSLAYAPLPAAEEGSQPFPESTASRHSEAPFVAPEVPTPLPATKERDREEGTKPEGRRGRRTLGEMAYYSPSLTFWSLVPNRKGYLRAEESGAQAVAVFAAASETFSQKNIGRSIAESLEEYERVVKQALADGCRVRGYVSTITHCPYEGRISPEAVLSVAERLLAMGCEEVSLGETLGRAEPADINSLLTRLLPTLPAEKLAGHFHDTGGRAIENVQVALSHGLRAFDSSAAGLGGCPFAPGAAGNVATETLVRFLESEGYLTGIDADKVAAAGQRLRGLLR